MYSYDGEKCEWNNMRANLEEKALMAMLGLNRGQLKGCFEGNNEAKKKRSI